jgi:hypothetical protein
MIGLPVALRCGALGRLSFLSRGYCCISYRVTVELERQGGTVEGKTIYLGYRVHMIETR